MKKTLLFSFVFLWACEALTVNPPPKKLLTEEMMEDIIFDRVLLRTMEASRLVKEDSLNLFNEEFILRKYQVEDSILSLNLEYYAQNPKLMSQMYGRIEKRLDHLLDSLELLAKKEKEELSKE